MRSLIFQESIAFQILNSLPMVWLAMKTLVKKLHKNVKYKYHQNPENTKLFAVGMVGDEDLGQEITMKGVKYKYHQNADAPENHKLFATGMVGDEDLGQEITMKGVKYK